MFLKYPMSLWLAPKKNGLYIVKHQGEIRYVGIAFKEHNGRNLKQEVKCQYKSSKSDIDFMYDSKKLTSIKFIPLANLEEAEIERELLIKLYRKTITKYK